ncbi:MAG: hypothetical protein WC523_06340 [Patescibacteria group bacterium]|jgi:hypothetical protein
MAELTIELLESEINYASQNSDFQGAFEAYQIAVDWLKNRNLPKNSVEYKNYWERLIKLKFICLDYFDNPDDYVDLLKNYFSLSFQIPNFDFWSKLEIELIYITDLDERNRIKKRFQEALEKCENILIPEYDEPNMPRKVSAWIKDFIFNLGLDEFDTVKKMEYLSNSKFVKILRAEDKNRVQILLDIYEKLRLSSRTPEGYENSVVMKIDGKNVIYNRGAVEEVRHWGDLKSFNIIQSVPQSVSQLAPHPQSISKTAELEATIKDYAPNSLEYKALKQEIDRLKKGDKKR